MTTQVKGKVAELIAQLTASNTFQELNTFSKGITLGANMFLDPISEAARERLFLNKGMLLKYQTTIDNLAFAHSINITRTAGNNFTVGQFCSAFADNSNVGGSTFGAAYQAWNKPGAATDLTGVESAIINETSSTTSIKNSLLLVFKNRADGITNVVNGIAGNAYNKNATAIWIDSQDRSTAGEYCGYRKGIYFNEYAFDRDLDNTAIGIDFAHVHRNVGSNTPLTAYRMTAAIRFSDFQSILWNGDGTLAGDPTDPAAPVRTYWDSVQGRFKLTQTGNDKLSVDTATGDMYLPFNAWLYFDAANDGTLTHGGIKMRAYNDGVNNSIVMSGAFVTPVNGLNFTGASGLVDGTVGIAGAAAAPPATPEYYVKVFVNGVAFKMPLYKS